MENTTKKKASPDAEKQKNSLQPKSFFSNPKGELLHTCANSFLLCVCVILCFISRVKSRIEFRRKRGVHYHMFGRGEAKMAVCTPRLTP
jgi:hypothetical protein